MKSFTVIYRTGGTENCTWKRCLPVLSEAEASDQQGKIERQGYRAMVFDTDRLDSIGMPEGWNALD